MPIRVPPQVRVIVGTGRPKVKVGEIGVTPETVSAGSTTTSVLIENMSEFYKLYVSFDGGKTWKTIHPLGSFNIDTEIVDFMIKGEVDTVPYEIVMTVVP